MKAKVIEKLRDGKTSEREQANDIIPHVSGLLPSLLGADNPYPLIDVVRRLSWATDYLLKVKSYDGAKYEELEQCVRRASEIVSILEGNNG